MQITVINRTVRILIVEDNLADINLINELLKVSSLDYTLTQRETLSQALAFLAENTVDLILLDLTLPDSSGLQTFIRLHTIIPEAAVVIVTGLNNTTLATEAMRAGAQDYLVKGHIKSEDLVKVISFAVERNRLLWKQLERRDELEKQVGLLQDAISEHPSNDKLKAILQTLAESSKKLMLRDDLQVKQLQDYSGSIEIMKSELLAIKEDVNELIYVVQKGNGSPSLGTRLANVEHAISTIKDWIETEKASSLRKGQIKVTMKTAILAGLVSLISAVLGFLGKYFFDK